MDADRPVVMPEDEVQFRLAQLLLLMNAMANQKPPGANLERIAYYDFLSAVRLSCPEDRTGPEPGLTPTPRPVPAARPAGPGRACRASIWCSRPTRPA